MIKDITLDNEENNMERLTIVSPELYLFSLNNNYLNNYSSSFNSIYILSILFNRMFENDETLNQNDESISRQQTNLQKADSLLLNGAASLGYGYGDLRNTYYSYLMGAVISHSLQDYDLNYIYTLFCNKVTDEVYFMLSQPEVYYQHFTPVVEDIIIPSSELLYNFTQDFKNGLDWYIENIYSRIDSNDDLTGIIERRTDRIDSEIESRCEDVVEIYMDIWYAYWDWWYIAQWEVVVYELDDYKDDYDQFKIYVDELEQTINLNNSNIDILFDALSKPISNFLELKESDNDLYNKELDALREIMDDVLIRDYPRIDKIIYNNLNKIIRKV